MKYYFLLWAALCFGSSFSYSATAAAPPVIKLSPATAQLRTGETKTFTASTTGITAPATVVWKVVSTAPASTGSLGSVSSTGVYSAPAVVPSPNSVLVEAVDSVDSKIFATSTVTLLSALPTITSLAPADINTGLAYTLDIIGGNYLLASEVMFDGKSVTSRFVSGTQLQVTGISSAAAGTRISVTVSNPGPSAVSLAKTLTVLAPVQVQASPDKRTIRIGQTQQFTANVVNNSDQAVTWQVDGKTGGDSIVGTIDEKGLYTTPAVLPTLAGTPIVPNSPVVLLPMVSITAISHADPREKASLMLSLENATPVISKVGPSPVLLGSTNISVDGTGFAPGAVVWFGGVPLTTVFTSSTKLTAALQASMPVGRVAAVKVVNPNPGSETSAAVAVPVRPASEKMPYSDAVRFLEMASWGPTPESVAHLQQIGRDAWLAEQFAMPAAPWPDPNDGNEGAGRLQDAFFTNALTGGDQLRQRMAFALSHIMVVSSQKDMHFAQMVAYQRLLGGAAFGSFRTLLGDMTLNPAMGYYLDMVNNDKANPARNTVANENYAREVMQLFTVGLVQLDSTGQPVAGASAEYDQSTVTQMAKVFTGWTYAAQPGFASHWPNPEYYFAPMTPFESHHDTTPKQISLPVPCNIPAGGTAANDLTQALDCLFRQPTLAPFISYRLIQALVMSSPSPAYVGRVSIIFSNSHGDLKAVAAAILTDTEASVEGTGKLSEPVLYSTTLLRALNATVNGEATGVRGQTAAMGQDVLDAPSVFSYFSPFFKVAVPNFPAAPAISVNTAPEFQLLNAETAFARINFAYTAAAGGVSSNIKVNFANLQALAADAAQLAEAVNQALYRGEMTVEEKAAVTAGINASNDPLTRVRNAFYVAAGAPQFQVER